MKHYQSLLITGGILAAATIPTSIPAAATPAMPTAHELAALPGAIATEATAVNDFGTVVGYSIDANYESHAVKWSPSGTVTELADPPGHDYSEALGINTLGQIVGYSGSNENGDEKAVEWNAAGAVTSLGAVPTPQSDSYAYGINNLGEVVGYDDPGRAVADIPRPPSSFATLWRNGRIDDFGVAEEAAIGGSFANAVNDLGQIVGYDHIGNAYGSRETVRWNADGSYQQLPTLPGGSFHYSNATAINDLGVTVGNTDAVTASGDRQHAVRWNQNTDVTDLGILPGGITSYANGINNGGLVVGSATDGDGTGYAVTWGPTGTLRELPALPGGADSEALAVSDIGFIVGDSDDTAGNEVAVIWR